METTSAYSFTQADWRSFLSDRGHSPHVLPYLLDGLYRNRSIWTQHLSSSVLEGLTQNFHFAIPSIFKVQESPDRTVKFQVRLGDGLEVETVLIPFHKRYTACLSTQVGCQMNCSFCYTGTQGLKRNLTAAEIVGQYLVARDWLPGQLQPNIVFMGQGEPLHNVDEVLRAVKIFNDPKLLGLGRRQMTLSTVGYLPGLRKLVEFPQINLALSLHSPFDEERNQLIPINARYPLREVLAELDRLQANTKNILTIEYLMIGDFNMSQRHVDGLQELLAGRKVMINLIAFNPFPGSTWKRPAPEAVETFRLSLVEKKLRVLVRTTKGDDILAACGQLKIDKLARNYDSGT